jgi:hypothetical protein
MSTTSSVRALLAAAQSCVAEAARADRRGERRYAALVRQSARAALAEIRAITPPVAVDPEMAARQEKARAYAAVLMRGLH